MKKCIGYILSGIAGALILAGSAYVAYETHFKGFVRYYEDDMFEAGSRNERWSLMREGDEIAAKRIVELGHKSGWVGFIFADAILKNDEVSKQMKVKGTDEGFDKLDFDKRDALVMATLEGGISNIDLRIVLSSDHVRPRFDEVEYEQTFKGLEDGKATPNIIRSYRIHLKNNFTPEQKQRLKSCYDKLTDYENTYWNYLFRYGDTGACATPVEKIVEAVEAMQ